MKKLLFGASFLISFLSLASTSNCSFEAGQYTNDIELKVNIGDNPIIENEESYGGCEKIDFTKELADLVLENKVSTVESFYGKEAALKAREVYSSELAAATGGKLVNCKDSPVSSIAVIVNGDNSFLVINGGNAYFEMTKGICK